MTESGEPSSATFGSRFIEEWKRQAGSLSSWTWAEIQELRGLDQEGLARAVRRQHPLTPYAALQRIRTAESPEALARERFLEAQRAAEATARAARWMSILAILALPR